MIDSRSSPSAPEDEPEILETVSSSLDAMVLEYQLLSQRLDHRIRYGLWTTIFLLWTTVGVVGLWFYLPKYDCASGVVNLLPSLLIVLTYALASAIKYVFSMREAQSQAHALQIYLRNSLYSESPTSYAR